MKAPITKVTHSAARNITKYLNAVIIGFIVFGLVNCKANKLLSVFTNTVLSFH
jgi:hypothetical protein